jgi:hypothetical protein
MTIPRNMFGLAFNTFAPELLFAALGSFITHHPAAG